WQDDETLRPGRMLSAVKMTTSAPMMSEVRMANTGMANGRRNRSLNDLVVSLFSVFDAMVLPLAAFSV
ncbi:MAG: hypothetical protein ACE5EY_10820, partial [Anaerolineae bacterium]